MHATGWGVLYSSGSWFQLLFIFHPNLGERSNLTSIFVLKVLNGLNPPPSFAWRFTTWLEKLCSCPSLLGWIHFLGGNDLGFHTCGNRCIQMWVPSPEPPPQGCTKLVSRGNLTIRPIGRGLEIFRALRSNSTTLLPCTMFFLWGWIVETGSVYWKSFLFVNGCFFGHVQHLNHFLPCVCGCCSRDVVFFGGGKFNQHTEKLPRGECWRWEHRLLMDSKRAEHQKHQGLSNITKAWKIQWRNYIFPSWKYHVLRDCSI